MRRAWKLSLFQIHNRGITLAAIAVAFRTFAAEPPRVIDDCHYPNDAAASASWQPIKGSAPATVASPDASPALHLRCNFAGTQMDRASWDRRVILDLTECRGIQFEFFCRDASSVSYFSLFFQSGEGWYHARFQPQVSGWNTISVDKAGVTIEGQPAGWGAIKTLRLSAWRGADTDTDLYLRDIRLGSETLIALVRCDSAAQIRPGETASVKRFTGSVERRFQELNIPWVTLSDVDLTTTRLRGIKLVVLPHNPVMPDRTVRELSDYLGAGGRLLSFYGMPSGLRSRVKIELRGHFQAKPDGAFSAIRFSDAVLPGTPSVVTQRSWNIAEPKPVPGASHAIAEWLDDAGQSSGHTAVVASSNAVEMSHVLLDDDPVKKRRMLLAMAGYLVPEIWQQYADARLARVGRLAGYRNFDDAEQQIAQVGSHNPAVRALLTQARDLRESALKFRAQGRFVDACDQADQASTRALEAFCAAQRPVPGEFRAFWCYSAVGVEGMSWDAAIQRLAENGFTAVLPRMASGGVAYYPSEVLPVAPEPETQGSRLGDEARQSKGDQIAQCLAACRKHGLQFHVWKVNWNLGGSHAPTNFVERLRREGRLQADTQGKELLWLCPSHPDNQKLEIDSMVEIVRRYDVDGIHFDYIRYPDGDHCFCAGCKERFARVLSLSKLAAPNSSLVPHASSLLRWPEDVLSGGPHREHWLDWRRSNITTVVKTVSEEARAANPKIKLSAAVFSNWLTARDAEGQDWKLWCERGYLDFVCPMDYTTSDSQFENWVKNQKTWAGSTPCYPGIGAYLLTPDRVIGQIQATRRHATHGFTLFNYEPDAAKDLVPLLGHGMTKNH